ncbi:Holliday junction resolvase YqgF [Klebsiella pneumoniae]|uniref:Holliday junction resolvase YqgF n=1 Tax=Klebsiella pneumoniae TaxID=573 RepID=A0A2X3CDA6_KLEPN|nr:Holliday junction resolvase YqgF [Klebsiella pneumoniae]STW87021.1 Holliday junction resolvase YqgF [Klebsiella pneumoniae]
MSGTFLGFDFGTKSIGVAVDNASPRPHDHYRR